MNMNYDDIDYQELYRDCTGIYGMTAEEIFIDVLQGHDIYHSDAELDVLLKMKEWRDAQDH